MCSSEGRDLIWFLIPAWFLEGSESLTLTYWVFLGLETTAGFKARGGRNRTEIECCFQEVKLRLKQMANSAAVTKCSPPRVIAVVDSPAGLRN